MVRMPSLPCVRLQVCEGACTRYVLMDMMTVGYAGYAKHEAETRPTRLCCNRAQRPHHQADQAAARLQDIIVATEETLRHLLGNLQRTAAPL
jgi:hypothetical protein